MSTAPISTERLEEMLRGTEGVQGGPWKLDSFACYIWAPSEKGGEFPLMDEPGENGRVAELRGWGYYTGTGHGALGLDPNEAKNRQRLTGEHVARLDPDTVRSIVTELLARRQQAQPTREEGWRVKELDWQERHDTWSAECVIGDGYIINYDYDEDVAKAPWSAWAPDGSLGHFADLDEAKAAAQADYASRISSAIIDAPAREAGGERVGWETDAEWGLEQRAFAWANNSTLPTEARALIGDLWKQYVLAASLRVTEDRE